MLYLDLFCASLNMLCPKEPEKPKWLFLGSGNAHTFLFPYRLKVIISSLCHLGLQTVSQECSTFGWWGKPVFDLFCTKSLYSRYHHSHLSHKDIKLKQIKKCPHGHTQQMDELDRIQSQVIPAQNPFPQTLKQYT